MTQMGSMGRVVCVLVVALAALAGDLRARDSMADQVTIYRDDYAVPHIVGETEEATFFGHGYAQAQDHLEKMFLEYRDAQGRQAEVLGFEALGDGYLRFIPHEYRWDGDYLQRLLRTKRTVVERGGTFPMDGTGVFYVLHPHDGHQQEDGTIHCDDGWGHLLVVEEGSPKKAWSLLPLRRIGEP